MLYLFRITNIKTKENMKAQDLMIGDWVEVSNTALQIAALGTAKAGFIDAKGEMFYHYYNNIEPIPLTAEILEKNGFVDGGDIWAAFCPEDEHYALEITWDETLKMAAWSFNSNEYWVLKLRYVHELQHALRLCRIEKDIKL